MRIILILTTLAAGLVPALVLAQAPPSPATPPPPVAPPSVNVTPATNCAPTTAQPGQGTIATGGATTGSNAQPLGDRLARSDGVLCPPSNVDPQMRAPTPEAGPMPVIPPPGSPGGDPAIRPK